MSEDSIDDVVYSIRLRECEKPDDIAEVIVVAKITGYFGVEKRFSTTTKIAQVQYRTCDYRNTHHELKVLNIMPYYTTDNLCHEDIDFRIQANLMLIADEWEQCRIHVTMKKPWRKIYETGNATKQEILQEAINRDIKLPVQCNFPVEKDLQDV